MKTPESSFDFSDVDRAGRAELVGYLDAARLVGATTSMKRQSIEALRLGPGDRALDVGCGTGEDAVAMAELVAPGGRALGVDLSQAMIEQALARHGGRPDLEFRVADITALPFGDGEFSAVRTERTLQHVPDLDRAIAELVRVAAPGARVLALEPDWATLAVDHPDLELSGRVTSILLTTTKNPTVGRELRRRLLAAGLVDVELTRWVYGLEPLPTFRAMVPIDRHHQGLGPASPVSGPDLERWWAELAEIERTGGFTACVTGFQAVGRKV